MTGRRISITYFYLVSAISLVVLVIGIFHTVTFIVNSTMYEKYPLRWGGVDNCEDSPYSFAKPIMPAEEKWATSSAEEKEKALEVCRKNQEQERRQHRVEDIKNAVTFSLVGILLFSI